MRAKKQADTIVCLDRWRRMKIKEDGGMSQPGKQLDSTLCSQEQFEHKDQDKNHSGIRDQRTTEQFSGAGWRKTGWRKISRLVSQALPLAPAQRRILLQVTLLWLVTRLTLFAFTAFVVPFEAMLHPSSSGATSFSLHELAAHWLRWDALWYQGIAQHGYTSAQATVFFPLYPLLFRGLTFLIGPHWLLSSMLVANLGTLGGFIGLGFLAAYESGKELSAFSAVRVAAAYPLAFFLAAPYTDGLFLATAAFALLAMRQGNWRLATLCVCGSLATRLTGVILLAPLLWEYGRQHSWWQWVSWRAGAWYHLLRSGAFARVFLLLGGSLLGLGLYMLFLWAKFGNPLVFLRAEGLFWHHTSIFDLFSHAPASVATQQAVLSPPPAPSPLVRFWGYEQARSLVDIAAVVLFAVLTIIGVRRLPLTYTLYLIGLLVLIISSPRPDRLGLFVSAGRYLTAALPIFLLLGRWTERYPWLDMLVVSGGFLLQATFAAFFLSGGWMV